MMQSSLGVLLDGDIAPSSHPTMPSFPRRRDPSPRGWRSPSIRRQPLLHPYMDSRLRGNDWKGRRGLSTALLVLVLAFAAPTALAQSDLTDVLRRQAREARVAERLQEMTTTVPPRPPARLTPQDRPTRIYRAYYAAIQARRDSVERARHDSLAAIVRLDAIDWDRVAPSDQGTFIERFREAYWVSARPGGLPIDTVATKELRGRLQRLFGRPTRNADALRQQNYSGSQYVQFEYWFVVNDSIPALILDIDGPFGDGLVLAGDEAFEKYLPLLKADLSDRLTRVSGPDPWVDYYNSYDRGEWYRTGYNGTDTFIVSIRPPRWSFSTRSQRWTIHR